MSRCWPSTKLPFLPLDASTSCLPSGSSVRWPPDPGVVARAASPGRQSAASCCHLLCDTLRQLDLSTFYFFESVHVVLKKNRIIQRGPRAALSSPRFASTEERERVVSDVCRQVRTRTERLRCASRFAKSQIVYSRYQRAHWWIFVTRGAVLNPNTRKSRKSNCKNAAWKQDV